MKRALVLGASGGMGFALVRELVLRDVEVIAFARGEERLKTLYEHESKVKIFAGNALNQEEVMRSAEGVDVIFHALNFPYPVWNKTHPLCMEIIVRVAEVQQAKIALVDNIYAYGAQPAIRVTEEMTKVPHTKKGGIRLAMENILKSSIVPSLIVHMPDLYGPNAESTLLHETFKSVVRNKSANFIGNTNVAREYLYTFDGAKAMVELAFRDDAYNQNWNIPAVHTITGEKVLEIVREETGYEKRVKIVSKTMIRFIGMFHPFMREMVEMMYLTEKPVILSGEKYENEVGPVPGTPYRKGIKETLLWMDNLEARKTNK